MRSVLTGLRELERQIVVGFWGTNWVSGSKLGAQRVSFPPGSSSKGECELEREKLGSKLVSFPPGRRRGSCSKGEWDRNGECCRNTLE